MSVIMRNPSGTLRSQMKTASKCLACDGTGFKDCQVCMGEHLRCTGLYRARETVLPATHAMVNPIPTGLRVHVCRQGHNPLPSACVPAAAAASKLSRWGRGARHGGQRASAQLVPGMRHDAAAALFELPGRWQGVPAHLNANMPCTPEEDALTRW